MQRMSKAPATGIFMFAFLLAPLIAPEIGQQVSRHCVATHADKVHDDKSMGTSSRLKHAIAATHPAADVRSKRRVGKGA